jgi:hypothetical protein
VIDHDDLNRTNKGESIRKSLLVLNDVTNLEKVLIMNVNELKVLLFQNKYHDSNSFNSFISSSH